MSENSWIPVSIILGFVLFILFKFSYVPWVVETLCNEDILSPEHCVNDNTTKDEGSRAFGKELLLSEISALLKIKYFDDLL